MDKNQEPEFEDQRKDEEIILMQHQHPWVLAKMGLIIVVLAALVFLSFLIWHTSTISIIFLIAAILIVAVYLIIRMFIYKNSVFILTNYRVININQDGLFRRKVQETELENIYNLQYEINGPIKSLMNFGNIELTTQGDETNLIRISNIENPHFIYEKISDAKRRALDKKNS